MGFQIKLHFIYSSIQQILIQNKNWKEGRGEERGRERGEERGKGGRGGEGKGRNFKTTDLNHFTGRKPEI